ncbi:hypothetical protein V2W45_1472728 [Cenococcum geophilum]
MAMRISMTFKRGAPQTTDPAAPPYPAKAGLSRPPLYSTIGPSGFTGRKSAIFKFPDKRTDAYFVDYRTGFADLVVRRGGASGPTVGTIVFYRWSNYIELVFEGNQRFFWKGTHDYGVLLMAGGSLKLKDTARNVYAAYTRLASMSKEGRLSIMVSFIAVAKKERRQRGNNAATAGASAGAAIGGGC